jgi:hypothetical protein
MWQKTVIPAKAGIQRGKKIGFRVEPGITTKVKGFMTHYTSEVLRRVRFRIIPKITASSISLILL